ncbi:ABC transporter permease subunit [Bacillus sp. DNRA2]|uniref:ABC transporter permease subunit n=1 Tax=Bacillus sp. DNRA2 TaxID=2723053 RepID=UPI00145CF816|nr:ABC transporter permease subunit [Bacillus sp. DNRA2]NMD71437.1 ABC transporter permease subunit [Bacillus sp. DNRA2]
MVRIIQQVVLIFVLILFLAAIPTIVGLNPAEKQLSWDWSMLPTIYGDFITEIMNGSLGTYQLGSQQRQIADDIGGNFITSLQIMLVAVNLGIILSLLFGVFVSRYKLTRFFNLILNILSAIPDFIIIVLSLLLAVKIYKLTGIRIISFRADAGVLNIWFPMVLVAIAPTLYLFKLIAVKYYQISGEDYIRTAIAKGLRLNYINFQHVYKNIEPFILAELTKIVSLAIGNMFIVEYLLNVPGITKFIFQSKEIQPIAIGLFSMLIISLLVYFSVRTILYLFKRGFIHE